MACALFGGGLLSCILQFYAVVGYNCQLQRKILPGTVFMLGAESHRANERGNRSK